MKMMVLLNAHRILFKKEAAMMSGCSAQTRVPRWLLKPSRNSLGQALLLVATVSMAFAALRAASPPKQIPFPSLDPDQSLKVNGALYLPEKATIPYPALVVVHGTSGIDSRGGFYRDEVLQAGVAYFEVDFKTGIFTSPSNRPPNDSFLPLAFAALKVLRKEPILDPGKIGIMGFSMGGQLTLNTAIEKNRELWLGKENGFVCHVAFYPGCKFFISKLEKSRGGLTGSPMIVFYGTKDSYGDAEAAPALKRLLSTKYKFELETVEYPGAEHGFNRNERALTYADPAAIGGRGSMAWDAKAAEDSRTRTIDFVRRVLGTTNLPMKPVH
jgi:dienelactone hydrolase